MTPSFDLLPQSASAAAHRLDHLALAVLLLTSAVALAVLILIVWFGVRYRAGSPARRDHPPRKGRAVELAWTVVPLLLFCGIYAWGAIDYADLYRAPADAMTVFVVAKQWMWKAEHPNGRREINEIHVPLGRPVRLVLASQDVIHSLYVPAFRIKQDVVPGRYTSIWFLPTRTGTYHLFCAEYCGTEHASMRGRVIVQAPADYGRWLASGDQRPGLAARGAIVFRELGCGACHAAGASVRAPDLRGLFGRRVRLQDGGELTADEAYVRDAILLPQKQIVQGYAPLMPSYAGQIGEDDLLALIAFLKESR